MEVDAGPTRIFLDELVVYTVICQLSSAHDLEMAASVNKACHRAAEEVAAQGLLQLLTRLHVLPLRPTCGSRIRHIGAWSSVLDQTVLWYRAADSVRLAETSSPRANRWPVAALHDLTGHGLHACAVPHHQPSFFPDVFAPGIGAIEFSGRGMLQTLPFVGGPLKQPLTLMIVAKVTASWPFPHTRSCPPPS